MRHYIKEIGKHSTIYSISNILTKAIGIILIPIYTKFLSVEDYGIISIISPLIAALSIIYTFGLKTTLNRFYFDYEESSRQQKILIGNVVILLLIFCVFFNGLFLLFRNTFEKIFTGISFSPFIILALLTASTFIFYDIKLTLFRVREQSLKFGAYSIARFSGIVVLTIVAVVHYSMGALGKVLAEFIITIIFFIISCIALYKEIILKIDIKLIKSLLKYALPIVPHALAGAAVGLGGKLFLNYFDGLESIGIYNIGFLIGSIMNIIVVSINLAWNPFFIKIVNKQKNEAKPIIAKLSTYYMLFISFIALGISFFGKEAVLILTTEEYYQADSIIPIIVFNYFLSGLYYIIISKIFYIKKAVKYIPFVTLSTAFLYIFLNYYLIPHFGIYGTAWALFITTFIRLIITFIISQKVFFIKYEYKKLIILLLILIISIIFYLICDTYIYSIFWGILFKLGILFFFFILLHIFRFLNKSEIDNLKDIYNKLKVRYIKK